MANFRVVYKCARPTPNEFLLQETHGDDCFCLACRSTRYMEEFVRNSSTELRFYYDLLAFLRNKRCKRVFTNTLRQIVNGKAYKEKCLADQVVYTYWKPWAKQQPQFKHMPNEDLEALSRFLSACCSVYDKWSVIVENMTNPEISPDIDASTFSVDYFQRAIDPNWCLRQNAIVRRKVSRKEGFDLYDKEKLDDILAYIISTGIFQELEYHGRYVADFGSRLTQVMLSYAQRMRNL